MQTSIDRPQHPSTDRSALASWQGLRAFADAIPDAAFVLDTDGRYVEVLTRDESLLFAPADQLRGRLMHDVLPEESADTFLDLVQRTAETGAKQSLEYSLDVLRGQTWFEARTAPIGDEQPARLVMLVTRDVTERKRNEMRILAQKRELERSNEELRQFAYVASHDLREPLRMVTSFTRLLQDNYGGRLDDEAHAWIDFAVDGARRMDALINDLLSYSRVGSERWRIADVDTSEVLDTALANLDVAIAESGARIERGAMPQVRGDATLLTQLLQNLVSNAVKYTDGEPPRIEIGAVRGRAYWLFYVRDNGIGIELEHTDRIFRMFQRLHVRSRYPGTGMGLAICKRIVERYGGRISVVSEPRQGSTFTFTLPIGDIDVDST